MPPIRSLILTPPASANPMAFTDPRTSMAVLVTKDVDGIAIGVTADGVTLNHIANTSEPWRFAGAVGGSPYEVSLTGTGDAIQGSMISRAFRADGSVASEDEEK